MNSTEDVSSSAGEPHTFWCDSCHPAYHLIKFCVNVTGWNFLTWVDFQFPLSPSPNSWIIKVGRQRELEITLG